MRALPKRVGPGVTKSWDTNAAPITRGAARKGDPSPIGQGLSLFGVVDPRASLLSFNDENGTLPPTVDRRLIALLGALASSK